MTSRFLTLTLFVIVGLASVAGETDVTIDGRHDAVLEPSSGKSSASNPARATEPVMLWCRALKDGASQFTVLSKARWYRIPEGAADDAVADADHEITGFPKPIVDNGLGACNATLDLGLAPVTAAGKYQCDLYEEDGTLLGSTNSYVNMRPVIQLSDETKITLTEKDGDSFALIADEKTVAAGEQVQLFCPAIGYPYPSFEWEKNGVSLGEGERLLRVLTIESASASDSATYKCIAFNRIKLGPGIDYHHFSVSVEFPVRVT